LIVSIADGVGAKKGLASAPPAASDNLAADLYNKVGLIADQLAINAKNGAKSAIDLSGGIIASLKRSNRTVDKRRQNVSLIEARGPYIEIDHIPSSLFDVDPL